MSSYIFKGFIAGAVYFLTGKWYAPALTATLIALCFWPLERFDNLVAKRCGKPPAHPFPTFGALATIGIGLCLSIGAAIAGALR
jgi:hypothetical protein